MPGIDAEMRGRSRLALDLVYGRAPAEDGSFGRAVLWDEEGSAVARELLATASPA